MQQIGLDPRTNRMVLLAWWSLLQDSDVERLLDELSTPRAQQAEAELIRIGRRAEAALKRRLDSLKDEAQGRAGRILQVYRWQRRLGDDPSGREFALATTSAARLDALIRAGDKLKPLGDGEALLLADALIAGLDSAGRANLLDRIIETRLKAAVEVAVRFLDESDLSERAAEFIGAIGATSQAPRIAEKLRSSSGSVRATYARVLADLGAKDQAPAIEGLLDDADADLQAKGAEALTRLWGEENARLVSHPSALVRRTAIETLGQMGAKRRAREIAARLSDSDPEVVRAAILALAELGSREHVPDIERHLVSADPDLRRRAAGALIRLWGKDEIGRVQILLSHGDASVRRIALIFLGRMDVKEHRGAVAALLKDPDPSVRETALEALVKTRAEDHAQQVAALLEDPELELRGRAAECLATLRATGFADSIAKLLDSSDPNVRCSAADALARLGAKTHSARVAALLKDSMGTVRVRAAESLKLLGDGSVLDALREALTGESRSDVRAALESAIRSLQ
jgi:HEAT repeat protein